MLIRAHGLAIVSSHLQELIISLSYSYMRSLLYFASLDVSFCAKIPVFHHTDKGDIDVAVQDIQVDFSVIFQIDRHFKMKTNVLAKYSLPCNKSLRTNTCTQISN